MAIRVGTMLNFPACKRRQLMHIFQQCQLFNREKAMLLLYLPIDHDIKANAVYFIQCAVGLAVLIVVVAGKSAGRHNN